MNDKAVCKTAPATQGLLIYRVDYYQNKELIFFFILKVFFTNKAKKASAKGRSPLQELEKGLRSGPYRLVFIILKVFLIPSPSAPVD